MTLISVFADVDDGVDILHIFPFVKITRFTTGKALCTRRCKIPHPGYGGAILSMQYKRIVRGIVRETNSKGFRNSITMDVSTSTKNVSAKLSSNGIHMCGALSLEMGEEVAETILREILEAQRILNRMREEGDLASKTIEWVIQNTMGEEYTVIDGTNIIADDKPTTATQTIVSVVIPPEYPSNFPQDVDAEIARFCIIQAPDFWDHSLYSKQLRWSLQLSTPIVPSGLRIDRTCKSMVNYNYQLPWPIERFELCTRIDHVDGFMARYRNIWDHAVTIVRPFSVPEDMENKIIRKKSKHVSLIVYQSGRVTQSGPCEEINREVYERFWIAIGTIATHIRESS